MREVLCRFGFVVLLSPAGAAPVFAATCESLEALKLASATITQSTVVTRPLCPYPQAAMYSGAGATNDAPNFVCRSN
jgi:hypothetical protein